jgi:predicted DsbA family dithiol-disulfide isomerase
VKTLVQTDENIAKVDEIIKLNQRMTLEYIALESDLSSSTVYRILSDDLGLRKITARSVPTLLLDKHNETI